MGMKRRDFLFLAQAGEGCVRLSCEQLYMHYRDLERAVASAAKETPGGAEWWAGEPESALALESPEEFFRRLGETLRGKRRLELTDPEWLADSRLRQEVGDLLDEFRAGGGKVAFAAPAQSAEAST